MLFRRTLLLVLLTCWCGVTSAQQPAENPVERWLAELSSPNFTNRQTACKNLAAKGAKAVPAIIALCETSQDRETVIRGVQIIAQMLDSRDESLHKLAEASLQQLSASADKSVALLAKNALGNWRMDVCFRTVDRLRRLGASVGQPTTSADGTPEVYLQINSKDWRGEDADLQLLPDLGRIGLFKVDQAPIGNEGLRFLEKCRSVERIYLDHTRIDARGLAIIAKAPQLKKLTLIGLNTIDREGLESLASITTLEHLSLDACNITSAQLPILAKFSSLQQLDLSRTKITDAGLGSLAELPKLNTLNLTGITITGEGIAGLAKAPALDTLNLRAAHLEPGALDAIGKLEQVRYLILDEVDLHAADFSKLAGMKGLRRLDLSKCQINDNNAWTLGTLRGVTYLLLRGNPEVSSNVRDRLASEIRQAQILQ